MSNQTDHHRLRILIWCPEFFPHIGGMQVRADLLARTFMQKGHDVRIITASRYDGVDRYPYDVLRQPTHRQIWSMVKWADVFYHAHYALRPVWPLLFMRRAWVAGVHMVPRTTGGSIPWSKDLKLKALRFAHVITPSQAVARELPVTSTVIANPVPEDRIKTASSNDKPRSIDILFVGRLERRKGVHVLLDAVANLKRRSMRPTVAIVGAGPEEQNLQAQATELGLGGQVTFAGARFGEELGQYYRQSKFLVVPSICEEAFGIVAIEGIACGCVVIASHAGGLPEAVGRCGVTFETGNASALAAELTRLINDPDEAASFKSHAPAHLDAHRPEAVAEQYLDVFRRALAAGLKAR